MSGFATFNPFQGLPDCLHWESIKAIKMSHEVAMLSALLLQSSISLTSTLYFHSSSFPESEHFRIASTTRDFVFASRAREARARTNALDGMLLGHSENGDEIWASLVSGHYDQYACDGPNRAFLELQLVKDRRTIPELQAVEVEGLQSIDKIAQWHYGISGNGVAEKYAFAYDALVSEAKGNIIP